MVHRFFLYSMNHCFYHLVRIFTKINQTKNSPSKLIRGASPSRNPWIVLLTKDTSALRSLSVTLYKYKSTLRRRRWYSRFLNFYRPRYVTPRTKRKARNTTDLCRWSFTTDSESLNDCRLNPFGNSQTPPPKSHTLSRDELFHTQITTGRYLRCEEEENKTKRIWIFGRETDRQQRDLWKASMCETTSVNNLVRSTDFICFAYCEDKMV